MTDAAEEPDETQDLSEEFGPRLFDQTLENWALPEAERRQARGELPDSYRLRAVQVVFWVGREPVVRLNEEVRGQMLARATRDLRAGEEVYDTDFDQITGFELPDEEADAAHITLFSHAGGWSVMFDGTYNTALVAKHLDAAEEFFAVAEFALARGALRAFAENAFASAELLAKAELLPLPDQVLLGAKTHKTVASRLHEWAQLGNIDSRFARLLSRLEGLRPETRYVGRELRLDTESAQALFEELKAMREAVREMAPTRGLRPGKRPREVKMRAAAPIAAGDFVALGGRASPAQSGPRSQQNKTN